MGKDVRLESENIHKWRQTITVNSIKKNGGEGEKTRVIRNESFLRQIHSIDIRDKRLRIPEKITEERTKEAALACVGRVYRSTKATP